MVRTCSEFRVPNSRPIVTLVDSRSDYVCETMRRIGDRIFADSCMPSRAPGSSVRKDHEYNCRPGRTSNERTNERSVPPCHGDAADRVLELGTHTRAWRAPRTACPSQAVQRHGRRQRRGEVAVGGLGCRATATVYGGETRGNERGRTLYRKFWIGFFSYYGTRSTSPGTANVNSKLCSHRHDQRPVASRAMLR